MYQLAIQSEDAIHVCGSYASHNSWCVPWNLQRMSLESPSKKGV